MSELRKLIKTQLFHKCDSPFVTSAMASTLVCNFPNEIVIDGIPVCIKIKHQLRGYLALILYNVNIVKMSEMDEDDMDYNLLGVHYLVKVAENESQSIDETVETLIQKIKDIFASLRFDKYIGKFVRLHDVDRVCLNNDIVQLFQDIPTVDCKLKHADLCCVCLEPTLSKTHCNHYLCFECVVQMNSTPVEGYDDDEIEFELHCPVCRCEVIY